MKLEEEIRETCRTERERAFASQAEARDSYHRQYPEGRSESKKKVMVFCTIDKTFLVQKFSPRFSFSSKYNYYDGNKHESNYLYNSTRFFFGSFVEVFN